MDKEKNTKITFIIPTIGRESLKNVIECLKKQTSPYWKAIIVFDGLDPNLTENDERIQMIQCEKLGQHNSAGLVRNCGIEKVTTEWVGFIDDDDVITNDYVELFLKEIRYDTDVIIFRMFSAETSSGFVEEINRYLPRPNSENVFFGGELGISFAAKKIIFDSGLHFVPSEKEDFEFLQKVRNNFKLMASPYVTYFVRENDTNKLAKNEIKCMRSFY
jgi:glycosyltransferase involved in cell wall biosynthesis